MSPPSPHRHLVLAKGVVDLVSRTLAGASGPAIHLTPKERDLLAYLAEHPDRVVPRGELLTQVWHYAPTVRSRAVDKTMVGLRNKVERDPADPVHLIT